MPLNLDPIRLSIPIALATSFTSAPVFQSSDIALIEEILCARKALAVNFDNSDDHTFVVNILSSDTHLHTHQQALVSLFDLLQSIPINILSGANKS
jgi:hypothetical protein